MEIYIIKVNLSLILFYLCYKLLFQRDTFWMLRRIYLLLSVLFSFIYPLISVEGWIKKQEPIMTALAAIQLDEFVSNKHKTTLPGIFTLENVLWGVFIFITLLMLARVVIQLFSIIKRRIQGEKEELHGIEIIRMNDKLTPFSFFYWIFINPQLHNYSETEEILEHELTHARQWHSIDVIIGQVQTMLCWFNPAAWLMEREIRYNLEFLADNQVLKSGFEPKKYQYHLLSLTYEPADSKLGNQFNVSPLKKRIKMMNSNKTKKRGLLKYALIIPIALVMLVVSNMQDMIASTKSLVENVSKNEVAADAVIQGEISAAHDVSFKEYNPKDKMLAKADKDGVFNQVDELPLFPGGDMAMYKWLGQNINYPPLAQEAGVMGRVTVQFIIDENGKILTPHVLEAKLSAYEPGVTVVGYGVREPGKTAKKKLTPEMIKVAKKSLEKESVRVFLAMPTWKPGKIDGKVVKVRFNMPVHYKLQ